MIIRATDEELKEYEKIYDELTNKLMSLIREERSEIYIYFDEIINLRSFLCDNLLVLVRRLEDLYKTEFIMIRDDENNRWIIKKMLLKYADNDTLKEC